MRENLTRNVSVLFFVSIFIVKIWPKRNPTKNTFFHNVFLYVLVNFTNNVMYYKHSKFCTVSIPAWESDGSVLCAPSTERAWGVSRGAALLPSRLGVRHRIERATRNLGREVFGRGRERKERTSERAGLPECCFVCQWVSHSL